MQRFFGAIIPGYLAVGAAIALSSTLLAPVFGRQGPFIAVNLIAYPILATATALGSSVAASLRETEATLVRALAESDRLTAEAHARLVSARERAARVLHSRVQGELTATRGETEARARRPR